MKYKLVLKNGKNNYQPLEYYQLVDNDIDIYNLENIDEFTIQFDNENALKNEFIKANFMDEEDRDKKLKIVFYENGKFRELKYGLLFQKSLDYRELVFFIFHNLKRPQVLNKIYNEFKNTKYLSDEFKELLELMKNIKIVQENDLTKIYAISSCPYDERRNLGIYILDNFYDILINEDILQNTGDKNEWKIQQRIRKNTNQ